MTAETDAGSKTAAPSIFPSSPKSITPDRSENMPASAASSSGVATRMVAASNRKMSV